MIIILLPKNQIEKKNPTGAFNPPELWEGLNSVPIIRGSLTSECAFSQSVIAISQVIYYRSKIEKSGRPN